MSDIPKSTYDVKDLMFDVFQIEGITHSDCRSVFMDWALSRPEGEDTQKALRALVTLYEPLFADHPMIAVLKEGLGKGAKVGRRGGWRARAR